MVLVPIPPESWSSIATPLLPTVLLAVVWVGIRVVTYPSGPGLITNQLVSETNGETYIKMKLQAQKQSLAELARAPQVRKRRPSFGFAP